jgi:hypothetical protein
MTDRSPRLEGQEWQQWATQLLHRRYALGDYQEVPDTQQGDAGIEGYSVDGCAYQMYGPEGELTVARRHGKLRDKMTKDVNKFIKNKEKLYRLFGSLKIKRWILFVPSFDSKEIVEHAAKKTAEILAADLPYIDRNDFRVVVLQEDAFAAERAHLLNHAVTGIDIIANNVDDCDADIWSEEQQNCDKVISLELKIAKLPTLTTFEKRKSFKLEVIKWWLDGQNILDGLRKYPEAWESIRRVKSEQEKYLRADCMISNKQPYDMLKDALGKIEDSVKKNIAALADSSRKAVAYEAVADWLMRCPLDFPESSER